MAPFAQAITIPDYDVDNMEYTELLTTSDNSVLKTTETQITTFEKEDGDLEGPFAIGVKAEKTIDDDNTAVLYVFSSAQLFTDQYDGYVSGNNKQLFSNIMGTVADHEVSVSIPVKSYELDWLTVTQKDAYIFKAVFMVIVPLILVVVGLVIWIKRRKR
jgi:ABC-2 type transport system permease protein